MQCDCETTCLAHLSGRVECIVADLCLGGKATVVQALQKKNEWMQVCRPALLVNHWIARPARRSTAGPDKAHAARQHLPKGSIHRTRLRFILVHELPPPVGDGPPLQGLAFFKGGPSSRHPVNTKDCYGPAWLMVTVSWRCFQHRVSAPTHFVHVIIDCSMQRRTSICYHARILQSNALTFSPLNPRPSLHHPTSNKDGIHSSR